MNAEFSLELPIANSSKFALPKIGTQLSSNFWVIVALNGDTKFSKILLEAVVLEPFKFILSFRANGTPAKSGNSSPLATISSTFFAVSSAVSSVKELNAPNLSSSDLILSNADFVSSTAEISLFLIALACSVADFFKSSFINSP